jgi:hypothetical protein
MPNYRTLASGSVAELDDSGRVTVIRSAEDFSQWVDYLNEVGRSCSICDGLGHGYPGGRPCPLEDRGFYEPDPWL